MLQVSNKEIADFYIKLYNISLKNWKDPRIRLSPEQDTISKFSHNGNDTVHIKRLIKLIDKKLQNKNKSKINIESKLESFIRKIVKEERKRMNENPQQNKTVKSLLTKWTDENTSNRQEYLYLLSKITEESLRDANFYHNGVLNKIPNIFRIKPEFDGNHLDKIGFKFGTIVSEKCDYIASDIIGAIEFFLRMNGYQTIADNLVKLLEN